MVLSFSSKFCIFVPFTNIQSHRRFDLSFRQTSEQVYRKPQHREKIFEKFQDQPRILRKMVLYSFDQIFHYEALNQYSVAQKIRFLLFTDFNLKQIYRKLQYTEKVLGSFNVCFVFPEKWCCIC